VERLVLVDINLGGRSSPCRARAPALALHATSPSLPPRQPRDPSRLAMSRGEGPRRGHSPERRRFLRERWCPSAAAPGWCPLAAAPGWRPLAAAPGWRPRRRLRRSLSSPKKREVWVACGNTPLRRVSSGNFSRWAGMKLEIIREVNGLVGKIGDK
jgi:hypothetical protein